MLIRWSAIENGSVRRFVLRRVRRQRHTLSSVAGQHSGGAYAKCRLPSQKPVLALPVFPVRWSPATCSLCSSPILHSEKDRSDKQQGVSEKPGSPTSYLSIKGSLRDLGPVTGDTVMGASRKFISVVRAMSDFLLSSRHLDNLPKFERRSPYENEPPIVVFRRRDVERKAIEVHGSLEGLEKERRRRMKEAHDRKDRLEELSSKIRGWMDREKRKQRKRSFGGSSTASGREELLRTSSRVIYTAIFVNGANTAAKMGAWILSGSHAIFAEMLHSFADTANQLVLLVGMKKSLQDPDSKHPYGYTNARYVASLISGVGILCLGSGLSIYHGVNGLLHPSSLEHIPVALTVLSFSFVSEATCLVVAHNAVKQNAKLEGLGYFDYLRYGDPAITFVLLEDFAAVLGVVLAGASMGMSVFFASHIPDAGGSIIIGVLLAGVAQHIVKRNSAALVGTSIPTDELVRLNEVLEKDELIRGIHDVKGIDMGNSLVRYKAEIDIDGLELTRRYLQNCDLERMLGEVQDMKTTLELETFMLKHGERIVDSLGAEIDRIEAQLKRADPDVRHVDLEVL